MKIKTLTLNFALLLLIFSCTSTEKKKIDLNKERLAVLNTDFDFSKMSVKEGVVAATLFYSAKKSVKLVAESLPVEGKANLKKYYKSLNAKDFIINWRPIKATISNSADLAYTYGIFEYRNDKAKLIGKGTYVTIWKKQKNGDWKWVLDSANEGLEKKKPSAKTDSINTENL